MQVGSKTRSGLTYLKLGLLNVQRLPLISQVRMNGDLAVRTKLETIIFVSPVGAEAGAEAAPLACLACLVDLETPPTGAGAAAGRPALERRLLPRPPRREVLDALRMSSRLCSILLEAIV